MKRSETESSDYNQKRALAKTKRHLQDLSTSISENAWLTMKREQQGRLCDMQWEKEKKMNRAKEWPLIYKMDWVDFNGISGRKTYFPSVYKSQNQKEKK